MRPAASAREAGIKVAVNHLHFQRIKRRHIVSVPSTLTSILIGTLPDVAPASPVAQQADAIFFPPPIPPLPPNKRLYLLCTAARVLILIDSGCDNQHKLRRRTNGCTLALLLAVPPAVHSAFQRATAQCLCKPSNSLPGPAATPLPYEIACAASRGVPPEITCSASSNPSRTTPHRSALCSNCSLDSRRS